MRWTKHIVNVLLLVFWAVTSFGQEQELKEKADKLFENEQYVEATSMFLQLLSLHPKNHDYNFKYGTCLLFNSNEKQKAMRYLNYAIKNPSIDSRAFYFRGKALHLNYQFADARKMYEAYKRKITKKDKRYDVDREMQMCDNGKKLLTKFTDIIVSQKKEIDESKFFRLYHDMRSIGGEILVTERFQSKIDKKKGHVPIVHFPKNAKAVYYSSYGESDANGLDIYVRKRLPDNSWGIAHRLPGEVNTPYDEDFPYLHPSGNYLYFSSKGHNSMGGYDIFMSRYNTASNGFERISNVDFAISSPDDDLFYVVDSAYQNAYFASARQSESGKLHVYRVKVTRVPIQEVIVMGEFLSEINPENKEMYVTILSGTSGAEVGKFKSNGKGKYSHVFPKGGKYKYQVEIAGMPEITELNLELPFMDEFRPLKQKLIHTTVDGAEIVKIVNLFDEKVEGGEAVIAQVIRKKSELDVNIDQFDPKQLEELEFQAKRDDILAEMGFSGMMMSEVSNQLSELSQKEQLREKRLTQIQSGINATIVEKSKELEKLKAEQQEYLNKANAESDPLKKYQALNKAKVLETTIQALADEIVGLEAIGSRDLKNLSSVESGKITEIEKTFNQLLEEGNEAEALNLLAKHQSDIDISRNASVDGLVDDLVDQSVEMGKELDRLKSKNIQNNKEIERVKAELQALNSRLPDAKKKEAEKIRSDIVSKEDELKFYKEDVKLTKEDISGVNRKLNQLNSNISNIQDALSEESSSSVADNQVNDAVRKAKDVDAEVKSNGIDQQIAAIERDHPEVVNGGTTTSPSSEPGMDQIIADNTSKVNEIQNDPNASELEKTQALIEANEEAVTAIDKRVQELQTKLESDPENTELMQEQANLVQLKGTINSKNKDLKDTEAKLQDQSPDNVALTREDVIEEIAPSYTTAVQEIENNSSLSGLEKEKNLLKEEQNLLSAISNRQTQLTEELNNDPENSNLLAEQDMLNSIVAEVNEAIQEREETISELVADASTPQISSTQDVLDQLQPNYESEKASIESNTSLSELQREQELLTNEQELMNALSSRQLAIQQELNNNPSSETLLKEQQYVSELINRTQKNMSDHREAIDKLSQPETPALTSTEVLATVAPQYDEQKSEIESNSSLSPLDREKELLANEQELMSALSSRQLSIQQELSNDPSNETLLKEQELVSELINRTQNKMSGHRESIDELSQVESPQLTAESVINSVNPEYTAERTAIEQNNSLNELDQRKALQEADQNLISQLTAQLNTVDSQLSGNPDNQELLEEKRILNEVIADKQEEVNARADEIAFLSDSTPAVSVKLEDVIEELLPGYEADINSIKNDADLSELEKATQAKEKSEALQLEAETKLNEVNASLSESPEDVALLEQQKALTTIIQQTESEQEEYQQTINALNNVSSVTDVESLKTELLEDIASSHNEDLQEIEASEASKYEKKVRRWSVQVGLLDKLVEEKESIEKDAERNPEDASLKNRLQAVEELIAEQQKVIEAERGQAFDLAVNSGQYQETINEVDGDYASDIAQITSEGGNDSGEKIAEREREFQQTLEGEIEKRKKSLKRKYSVSVDLEAMILERELEASKEREATAENAIAVVGTEEKKENFIESLRNDLLEGDPTEVDAVYSSQAELEEQDALLESYENSLTERLEVVEEQLNDAPNDEELLSEKQWIEEEQEQVREKRRKIRISIGELETEVIAGTRTSPLETDNQLNELKDSEKLINKQLEDSGLSSSERQSLEKELQRVQQSQVKRENEVYQEVVEKGAEERQELVSELESSSSDADKSEVVKTAIAASEEEQKVIENLVKEADDARSEEERNYLLEKATQRQETLNNTLADIANEQQISSVEQTAGITVLSSNELEKRRRRVVVSIGALTTEIERVEGEITQAKKKELPSLEEELESLTAQRTLLTNQLEEIDSRLAAIEPVAQVFDQQSMEVEMSFNEEREIAASEEYKEYRKTAEKALEVENEITNLETELEKERNALIEVLSQPTSAEREENVQLLTRKIQQLESELRVKEQQLEAEKAIADAALPSNEEEAMKMQNLLIRGVKPIKTVVLATTLLNMPESGFAINPEATTSNYSEESPIPVGVEGPSGLVYRVQVGAFSRPIPQDLFKEFNPVSGEKIGTTGITRYMAGFFNSSESVVEARGQIRELGYRDAFVVAYCDGERITFGEARRLEAAGTCVPKGTSELVMEVANKTAENLGLETTAELKEVPELTYNLAPGAVEATPIEQLEGLFFTVQIAVYNRPVGAEDVSHLPEIMTFRLPNGQIRYSTGIFDTAEDAIPRQSEALRRGMRGSFITAYFEGERISVGSARRLLIERGPEILHSNRVKQQPVKPVETPQDVVRTDSVTITTLERPVEIDTRPMVQVVSKRTFDEFPRDVLNRYNSEGNFYYDLKDKRVKSTVYENEDYLPRLYKFKDDVDTVFLSAEDVNTLSELKVLSMNISAEKLPGDFIDWLIRLTYRKEMRKIKEGVNVRIYGVEPNELEAVQEDVRSFGLEPELVEEELENNNK